MLLGMKQWSRLPAAGLLGICLAACGTHDEQPSAATTPTCGPGTPIMMCPAMRIYMPQPTTAAAVPLTPTPAANNGLVTPRWQQCNFGPRLLHYLATGDNGGNPTYDQLFADDVGVPLPQARAIADKAIEDCDAGFDQQEANRVAATSSRAAATSRAEAAAELHDQAIANCAAIGAIYDETWDWCNSTVSGNPSGKAGSDCSNSHVQAFSGKDMARELKQEAEWYPGCFPAN